MQGRIYVPDICRRYHNYLTVSALMVSQGLVTILINFKRLGGQLSLSKTTKKTYDTM